MLRWLPNTRLHLTAAKRRLRLLKYLLRPPQVTCSR
jgi:hypothetical protein